MSGKRKGQNFEPLVTVIELLEILFDDDGRYHVSLFFSEKLGGKLVVSYSYKNGFIGDDRKKWTMLASSMKFPMILNWENAPVSASCKN